MSSESCAQRIPDRARDEDSGQSGTSTGQSGGGAAVARSGLLLVGVALVAANMRPAVTSLASLLGEVRDSLGASSGWASAVTAVPTVCFGVAGIGAPMFARRWGINRVIGIALVVLTLAMALRVVNGPWTVLAGTVMVCAAIAMCNVLIPVVVKESFPTRIGLATGLYTTAMASGGALGSTFSPMLKGATGSWQLALMVWASLALAALCVWVPATMRQGTRQGPAGSPSPASRQASTRPLWHSPLAWVVTVYFGMQSLVAYVVMGWFPEVLKGAGMDAPSAGAALGILLLVGVPMNMVLPPLVTSTRSQSGWALSLGALMAAGFLGLLLAPLSMPILWALLIGAGMAAFPLALTLISLRTRNAVDTSELSAMAQSIGYLIGSCGPLAFGLLHDATGEWSVSLLLVLVIIVIQSAVGLIAGRPRMVR